MFYKFYLRPGQMAPAGSTSRAMLDGGIVWEGDKWPEDSKLEAHEMSSEELEEYQAYLKFAQIDQKRLRITFADFWPKDTTKMSAKIANLKSRLDSIATSLGREHNAS